MKKLLSLTLVILMLFSTISINVLASTTPSDWAMNEVNNAKNAGIITNAITKNYQKDITREEFCELVVKLYEKLTNKSATVGTDIFTDTDNQEILKAYNLGIVKGVSSNQFAPYNNITRQEICVMLVRCIDVAIDGADINNFNNNNFADKNKISDWAADCVNYAYDNGIMKGVGNNCIDPLGNTTCEQSILLAYRIYDNQSSLMNTFEEISENDAKQITNLIKDNNILDNENASQQDIIDYLEDVEWIENVVETPDGGVSCRTDFGVTCVWTPYDENKIGGGNNKINSLSSDSTVNSADIYDVNSIVVLCPYASTDSNFNLDGYNYIGEVMEEYAGSSVTFLKDEEVSLETLKNLDQYDMVWFYSHGALSNVTNSAWAILDSDPYTMTGEFADSINKYVWLSEDFFCGRTIVNLSDGRIGVGGKFYEHYYSENELDNTFFHFASCSSMKTDKLANGILSRGAEWVEGYTNSVYFNNDYMHFVGVIASLVDGKNIQESISEASRLVKENYNFWQDDCQLTGLGNSNYRIKTKESSDLLTYMDELSPINSDRYTGNEGDSFIDTIGKRNGNVDVNGNEYSHGLTAWVARWNYTDEISWVWNEYDINGEYEYLQGDIVLIKSYNENNFRTKIQIIGDGDVLYEKTLTPSDLPIKNLKINVSDVDKLKISVKDLESVSGGTAFGLADFKLTK